MKKMLFLILIFFLLPSCVGMGQHGCSYNGEVCIDINLEEPIHFLEPNTVTISVNTTIDITGLRINLGAVPPIVYFEESQNWVNKAINWSIDIQANQPQVFARNFLLPEKDGYYQLLVMVKTNQEMATNSLYIHQKNGTSEVFYANTPIPYTPGLLPTLSTEMIETLQAIPTPTNYPTLIPRPTKTVTPTAWIYPPPSTPPLDGPGEEPYP